MIYIVSQSCYLVDGACDFLWYTLWHIVSPGWWCLWCDMIPIVLCIVLSCWWFLWCYMLRIVSCTILPGWWCLWLNMIYIVLCIVPRLRVLVIRHDIQYNVLCDLVDGACDVTWYTLYCVMCYLVDGFLGRLVLLFQVPDLSLQSVLLLLGIFLCLLKLIL